MNIKNNKSGFSIIEVVIALGIITVGMFGMLLLFVQNMQVRNYTKNKLVASMLAQEGIELVRNIRDQNWIDSAVNSWNYGAGAGTASDIIQDGDYRVDYINGISDVDGISNGLLYKNGGFYDHNNAGAATIFSRLIEVEENDIDGDLTNESLKLKSTVQWVQNGKTYDYVIDSMIFNWE